jgi:hypothetical protein
MMDQEPIAMAEKRFNYLPLRFMHRGEERRVRRVEKVWSERATWRRSPRRVYRVLCHDDQMVDLVHDVHLNAWYLERIGG